MSKYQLSKEAKKVLIKLNNKGYEAYIVGGSVRDNLLGLEPKDFDVTTIATPDQIIEVFKDYKRVELGKKYGTIGVIVNNQMIEITTYRTELGYQDGRRPDVVEYTKSLKEDLSRRDFTINAMAMDVQGKIYDYYNGKEDLKKKIVRTVGDPKKRFKEDKLRMLRAVRFASRLDFKIEDKTLEAIKELSTTILDISYERIRDELNGIILSEVPSRGMDMLVDTRLLKEIVPELIPTVGYDQMSPYHHKSLFKHMTCVMDNVRPVTHLRLAALLHDVAKPDTLTIDEEGKGRFFGHDSMGADLAKKVLKRLKYDNKTINKVHVLISDHMRADPNMKRRGLKRQIKRVGEDLIYDLLDLMIADMHCTKEGRDDSFLQERRLEVRDILESEEVVDTSGLVVDGNDLMEALSIEPGPLVGGLLDYLTEKVIDDERLNNKEELIDLAKKRMIDYE